MSNPNVPQGFINKVRGSITIPLFTFLNVTAPYLDKGGISGTLQGDATLYLETLTGAARSEQPYQLVEVTAHLLKTQNLSNLYKRQMETSSYLGDVTVRPDSNKLSPYLFTNCSIANAGSDFDFAGTTAGFMLRIRGVYPINSNLYNQAPQ